MATIPAVAGDTSQTIGAILKDKQLVDGRWVQVPVDLSDADSITCLMTNQVTGEVTEITGILGDADGRAPTPLPTLVEGRYWLEWPVVTGSKRDTYPSKRDQRPILDVREEADNA